MNRSTLTRTACVLAATVPLALAGSALAQADSGPGVVVGKRNPVTGAGSAETQIIANNASYGTRQSNLSQNGGGAIYGCRSGYGGTPQHMSPCMRSANLSNGFAFEFDTNGILGGTIMTAGGDGSRPFTTNATGVATGLNAERVGSKTPAQLTTDAVAAVQNTISYARVLETGATGGGRGVDAVKRASAGVYSVAFHSDVSKCALTATQSSADSGSLSTQLGPDNKTVTVFTRDGASPAALTDRAFSITATC